MQPVPCNGKNQAVSCSMKPHACLLLIRLMDTAPRRLAATIKICKARVRVNAKHPDKGRLHGQQAPGSLCTQQLEDVLSLQQP